MMKTRTMTLVAVAALWGSTAMATEPPTKASEAEALHRQGVQQMQQGKFAEASVSFRASYAKDQSPRELYNAARAELAQKHYAEAAKLYRTYLALPANDKMPAADRAEAKDELAEITKHLTTLDVRAKDFSVDGVAAEGLIDVEPGTHRVEMRGPAGMKTKSVECQVGTVVLVEYEESGKGAGGGQTPPPPPPPKEVEKSGSWVLPGVLAGVGVVGLGVGVGFTLSASSADSDGKALGAPRCSVGACPAVDDAVSKTTTRSTVALVGYIGGAAFLGGALVSALVLHPWEKRASTTGRVRFVPQLGGASVEGTF